MSNYRNLNSFLDAGITVINNGFNRAKNITCSDALLPKSRAPGNLKNLVLVMDYHPNFRDIPKLIKDHLSILYKSPRMKKVFSSNKTCMRTGFHWTKHLKDLLVLSALPDVDRVDSVSSDAMGCLSQFSTSSKTYQKRGYKQEL